MDRLGPLDAVFVDAEDGTTDHVRSHPVWGDDRPARSRRPRTPTDGDDPAPEVNSTPRRIDNADQDAARSRRSAPHAGGAGREQADRPGIVRP